MNPDPEWLRLYVETTDMDDEDEDRFFAIAAKLDSLEKKEAALREYADPASWQGFGFGSRGWEPAEEALK